MYASMMRIFKHYHFNVADSDTAARQMSFSSYPGKINQFYLFTDTHQYMASHLLCCAGSCSYSGFPCVVCPSLDINDFI